MRRILKVLQSTQKYPKVPQSTQKYLNVLVIRSVLLKNSIVWTTRLVYLWHRYIPLLLMFPQRGWCQNISALQHLRLKGGYRKIFFSSFIGPVGHNIWWEIRRNGSFGPKNGPKMPKLGLKSGILVWFRGLKTSYFGIFRPFLGPNEPFRLFSHHISWPMGPLKEKNILQYPPFK